MTNPAYEATNSDERLIAEMKAAAEKATSGEWWSDVVECDGTYGNGDECAEGFHSYAVYDSNNQTLLDMTNSTAACIQVDYDDESHYAWDEVAERNAEYIVLARPENVLKLIAALEQAQRQERKAISELQTLGEEFGCPGGVRRIEWLRVQLKHIGRLEKSNAEWSSVLNEAYHRIAELEAAPNGMMQLSNELAEMKRGVAGWKPERCPITGRSFFMWIDHPDLGYVPTYGGPYDSYTLAEKDEGGEYFVHRYDHDDGAWVDDEAVYLEGSE